MAEPKVTLRRAALPDAAALAQVLRRSLACIGQTPKRHGSEEDLAFIRDTVLPRQKVTVAEADGKIVGFIAVRNAWIDLLYVDPAWTGRGIGGRLLAEADMAEAKLYCFRSNKRACRFYEQHGFRPQAFSGGTGDKAGLPDVLYIRPGR